MDSIILKLTIVSDDLNTVWRLKNLAEERYGNNISFHIASTLKEAQQKIIYYLPNLLILDVNITSFSVFNLLSSIPPGKSNYQVIFVANTADNAIEAFNYSASGFILKPIEASKLFQAIERAKNNIRKETELMQLRVLVENLQHPFENDERVIFPLVNRRKISLKMEDILRCESKGDITLIHVLSNPKDKFTTAISISDSEYILRDYHFYRTHRQHLVNLKYVIDNGIYFQQRIKLIDGSEVPLARRRKQEFLKTIDLYKSKLI